MQQRLANPASLPGLEDGDRDLRAVTSFVIPDVARDAHALAAAWIDRQQRLVITVDASGYEDDALFAEGVGFTDIVKRATPRAEELRAEEYAHGRTELVRKLAEADAPLVIFTYKRTAEILFGRFSGAGLLSDRDVLPGEAFVMPGPYAPRVQVDATLDQLRDWLG